MALSPMASRAPWLAGVLLLALPTWAGDGRDEESFAFGKGTRWTYTGRADGFRQTVVQEVFQTTKGDLFVKGESATIHHLLMKVRRRDDSGDSESASTTSYLGVEGGFLVTGTFGKIPVRVYKLGSRQGDSWPCTNPRLKDEPGQVFTHLGEEKVVVPAGTFEKARHIRFQLKDARGSHTGDFYIVPGVGIVKSEASSELNGIKRSIVLELETFTWPSEF